MGHGDSGGPSDQIGFTQPASLLAEGASSSGAVIWRVTQQSFLSSAVPPSFQALGLAPGKFQEDQCPTELGRRAACQQRRQRTSWPALCPPQSGPIPWASGAGLCSLPSPASGKRGTRRQSIHSGGPESPSSLGAGPGVSPGENLCPEWGSRCWAVC